MRSLLTGSVGENSLEVAHCSSHQLVLRKQKLVQPKMQWQGGPPHHGLGGGVASPKFLQQKDLGSSPIGSENSHI